jgi:hypothetical protein
MSDNKKSYYAIIPANIRYDESLCPNAKLLYGEITALCNEKGYCWAANEYFGNLYNVHKNTISKWISQLNSLNFINIEIEQNYSRKIWINEKVDGDKPKAEGGSTKRDRGDKPKAEDNNTSNNTSNKYYNNDINLLWHHWNVNGLTKHTETTIIKKIQKKHFDIVNDITYGNVVEAITKYAIIINDPKTYWFTYKFTFWRFLEKIDTFLDSADPLTNYKIKPKDQPNEYRVGAITKRPPIFKREETI